MGDITHVAELGLVVGNHREDHTIFTVADIGSEDLIIGIDWLRKHNPEIDWQEGEVTLQCCEPIPKVVKRRQKKASKPIVKPRETLYNEDHLGYELADESDQEDELDMEWEDTPQQVPGKPEAA